MIVNNNKIITVIKRNKYDQTAKNFVDKFVNKFELSFDIKYITEIIKNI